MALESTFAHVLGTNYRPTVPELEEIERLLHGSQAESDLIQKNIENLRARQDELEFLIGQHTASRSPIQKLPDNILGRIFIECLPKTLLPTRNLREAPLLLTAISCSWRKVALGTPDLWNAIYIHLLLTDPTSIHRYNDVLLDRLGGIRRWLDRSGSLPLSIFLNVKIGTVKIGLSSPRIPAEEKTVRVDATIPFVQLLMEYYQRWKRVAVHIPAEALFLTSSADIPFEPRLPLLERFELARTPGMDQLPLSDRGFDLVHHLLRGSSLQSLHLHEEKADGLDFLLPPRMGSLTDLAITFPNHYHQASLLSPAQAIRVLSRYCLTLRSVRIELGARIDLGVDGQLSDEEWPVLSTVLAFPQLENLVIRFKLVGAFGPLLSSVAHFFETIVTPGLEVLDLNLIHPDNHWRTDFSDISFEFIPSFVEKSGCQHSLKTFSLAMPVSHVTVVDWCRRIPNLQVLRIVGDLFSSKKMLDYDRLHFSPHGPLPESTMNEDLVHALTPTPGKTILCPNLKNAEFTFCDPSLDLSLIAFGKARAQESNDHIPLQSFKVNFWRPIANQRKEQVVRHLKDLRRNGMDVRWRAIPGRERLGSDDPRASLFGRDPLRLFSNNESMYAVTY
ncbi:hypothetical protein PQX77_008604 [Marasmius sp. AFHP31]|nr:hypothetical protein PQX77_008604 [Marasmius sp. AFHP31]